MRQQPVGYVESFTWGSRRKLRASFFKGSPTGHGYDVSHSPQVFVVDPQARLRAEFYNASSNAMKSVVSALIRESAAGPE